MTYDSSEELPFDDRVSAGRLLARRLSTLTGLESPIVLALPRGGVPVAQAVARALHLPFDILVVRKVGHPANPEFAVGAVASGGVTVRTPGVSLSAAEFAALAETQHKEVARREASYRRGRPPLSLAGRTAILVDDGLATGATMLAAIAAARALGAAQVVAAAPVGSADAVQEIRREADLVQVPCVPEPFLSVGTHYVEFPQLRDADVRATLEEAA
jgi:predicted phosphoribosyltransferase